MARTAITTRRKAVRNYLYGIDFDGTNTYIESANTFDQEQDWTFVVDWKWRAAGTDILVSLKDGTGTGYGILTILANGTLRTKINGSSQTTTAAFDTNVENHQTVIVYDHSEGTVDFYDNGAFIEQFTLTTAVANVAILRMGQTGGGALQFNGFTYRHLGFTRTFTLTEVENLYYDNSFDRTSLFLEWLHTDATGVTVTDTSGSSNDGTITSGSWTNFTPFRARRHLQDFNNSILTSGTSNGYFESAQTPGLKLTTFTISERVYLIDQGSGIFWRGIWTLQDKVGPPDILLLTRTNNVATWGIYNETDLGTAFGIPVTYNRWIEPTFTVEGTNYKFYLDGKLLYAGTMTALDGDSQYFQVAVADGGTQVQKGYYARAIVCDFAMTPADVDCYYRSGIPCNNGVPATPLLDWDMTDGSGGTITDHGSLGSDAILAAGASWNTFVPDGARSAISSAREAVS